MAVLESFSTSIGTSGVLPIQCLFHDVHAYKVWYKLFSAFMAVRGSLFLTLSYGLNYNLPGLLNVRIALSDFHNPEIDTIFGCFRAIIM